MTDKQEPRWEFCSTVRHRCRFIGSVDKYDIWHDEADNMIAVVREQDHDWEVLDRDTGRLMDQEWLTFDQECAVLRLMEGQWNAG
jgi:hypothetical protein